MRLQEITQLKETVEAALNAPACPAGFILPIGEQQLAGFENRETLLAATLEIVAESLSFAMMETDTKKASA